METNITDGEIAKEQERLFKGRTIDEVFSESEKQYWEEIDKDPKRNQGVDIAGIRKRKYERWAGGLPIAFIESGIIAELSGKASKVLWALTGLTTKGYRVIRAKDKAIARRSVSERWIKKALAELEYWHIITQNYKKGKKRRDSITLNRWDTAKPLLLAEGKVIEVFGEVSVAKKKHRKRTDCPV